MQLKSINYSYKDYLNVLFIISLLLLGDGKINAQNDLNVIKGNWLRYSDATNSLYHYLTGQAFDFLKERDEAVSGITSLPGWQQRQKMIKETLLDIVGPFPEKTPLNAKILRVIERDGYRIEHIIYESQPGFFVTSSMFIPEGLKRRSKAPVVIYCSGHSDTGYRSPVYLHILENLVRKGFIVFAFDPVGQGERLEYFDPQSDKSIVGGPTKEHSYPGAQAFITGSSQARYMIWDGVRAVDYLLTRKEVDPARIGITGRSGGGTQSSYIAAMDERIYAAAPENYLTNFTRLLQTIGPQDAEQNMFNAIERGIDHPDFLLVRAPKPALMITTSRDMFNIQGVLETDKQVAMIYKAYGKEENFGRVEDDAPHASTTKNREAMYAFFQKHLNNPGSPEDLETKPFEPDDVRVTETGQVSTSLKGETVFSLNRRDAEKLDAELQNSRENMTGHIPKVIASARELSGFRQPAESNEPVFTGRIQRDGYVVEKYFVKGEGDYVIPYLLMIPDRKNNRAVIYLHPSGKAAEASEGGEIEWFVRNGFTVMSPDIIGLGEMGPGVFKGDAYIEGSSHNIWYASMLIGRSIVGLRAGDVIRLNNLLRRTGSVDEVYGFARKEMAPVLLHAAAFDPSISRIALIEPYSSYISIVMNRFYNPLFIHNTVPGALEAYDLPDLAASLAPRKLLMAGVTDSNGKSSDIEGIDKDLEVIKKAYRGRSSGDQLIIRSGQEDEKLTNLYLDWIK